MSPHSPVTIRTFYRIVWANPPTVDDFRSHAERGIVPRVEDPEIIRLSTGISVFRTIGQARKMAQRRPPWFGQGFIARIDLPFDSPGNLSRIERTTKTAGHYTIWSDAELLARWAHTVEPVTIEQDGQK